MLTKSLLALIAELPESERLAALQEAYTKQLKRQKKQQIRNLRKKMAGQRAKERQAKAAQDRESMRKARIEHASMRVKLARLLKRD